MARYLAIVNHQSETIIKNKQKKISLVLVIWFLFFIVISCLEIFGTEFCFFFFDKPKTFCFLSVYFFLIIFKSLINIYYYCFANLLISMQKTSKNKIVSLTRFHWNFVFWLTFYLTTRTMVGFSFFFIWNDF